MTMPDRNGLSTNVDSNYPDDPNNPSAKQHQIDHDIVHSTIKALPSSVQAGDLNLSAIATLDSSVAGVLVTDGAGWIRKSYTQFKAALGLESTIVSVLDAQVAEPSSTVAVSIRERLLASQKGAPGGVAPLDLTGKVPANNLPAAGGTVLGSASKPVDFTSATATTVARPELPVGDVCWFRGPDVRPTSALDGDWRMIVGAGLVQVITAGMVGAPGTPTLSSPATSVTATGFVSSWSSTPNTTDFLVQRRVSGGTFATVATVTGTTYTHTGLASSTSYDVRIIARNETGEGTPSNTVTTLSAESVTPAPVGGSLLVDQARLAAAPTSGASWTFLLEKANATRLTPIVVNSYDDGPAEQVAAAAYAFSKTGTQAYKDKVVLMCREIIGTENLTQSAGANVSEPTVDQGLATMRMLPAYVLAADLVGMDRTLTGTRTGETTRTWESWLLNRILYRPYSDPIGTNGRWKTPLNTLTSSASNWGAQAAQTCAAISVYTGETIERAKIIRCVRGMLGDQTATGHPTGAFGTVPTNTNSNDGTAFRVTGDFDATFSHNNGAAGWAPINPAGVGTKDGVCVEDGSRSSLNFDGWIAQTSQDVGVSYSYEFMTGLFMAVDILHNAGVNILGVGSNAPERALAFMLREGWHPSAFAGRWGIIPWVNRRYGKAYSVPAGIATSSAFNAAHFWNWLYGSSV